MVDKLLSRLPSGSSNPMEQFDPIIHPIQRLRICVLLEPVAYEEFRVLRDLLEMSDSALSKQLAALTKARYVRQTYTVVNGRRRVRVRLTKEGRRALGRHVAALQELAAGASQ